VTIATHEMLAFEQGKTTALQTIVWALLECHPEMVSVVAELQQNTVIIEKILNAQLDIDDSLTDSYKKNAVKGWMSGFSESLRQNPLQMRRQ
jgi:hypothetical protein